LSPLLNIIYARLVRGIYAVPPEQSGPVIADGVFWENAMSVAPTSGADSIAAYVE